MNETTERILIEALDLLEQGAGIDEIIARYPAQAADLRPFLLTAAALGNLASQPTVTCLLYTSPSPRDRTRSRMPSSA